MHLQEGGAEGQSVRPPQSVPERVRDRGHRMEGREGGGVRPGEQPIGEQGAGLAFIMGVSDRC